MIEKHRRDLCYALNNNNKAYRERVYVSDCALHRVQIYYRLLTSASQNDIYDSIQRLFRSDYYHGVFSIFSFDNHVVSSEQSVEIFILRWKNRRNHEQQPRRITLSLRSAPF